MNYRYLKISKYYPQYIEYFHKKVPVGEMAYSQMLDSYMNDHYIYGNSYSKYLRRLGNETNEIIYNDSVLLRKWAQENSPKHLSTDEDIIGEMIRQYKPDVIFWDGADYNFVNHIKTIFPNIRIHYSQIGVAIPESIRILPFDFVISCLKSHVEMMRKSGMRSEFIRHGFDHEILKKIRTPAYKRGFIFSGSIAKGLDAHQERARYILYLMNNTDINVYSAFKNPDRHATMKHLLKKILGKSVHTISQVIPGTGIIQRRPLLWANEPELFKLPDQLNNRIMPPLFGMDMFNMLASSEVVLNIHIGIAGKHAANLRMYETTGVGTCMLTDYKSDICEYFEPDSEVLTFQSPEEAMEKYQYLIQHPEEIDKIAHNGQERTLKDHTMKQRIEELDNIIKKSLKEGK